LLRSCVIIYVHTFRNLTSQQSFDAVQIYRQLVRRRVTSSRINFCYATVLRLHVHTAIAVTRLSCVTEFSYARMLQVCTRLNIYNLNSHWVNYCFICVYNTKKRNYVWIIYLHYHNLSILLASLVFNTVDNEPIIIPIWCYRHIVVIFAILRNIHFLAKNRPQQNWNNILSFTTILKSYNDTVEYCCWAAWCIIVRIDFIFRCMCIVSSGGYIQIIQLDFAVQWLIFIYL
jgi:hypothetical protein